MEEVELKFGEGRISGAVSVFLGALSVIAVLCFHFPEYLTTPALRQSYPVEHLRDLLRAGMVLGVVAGSLVQTPRALLIGVFNNQFAIWTFDKQVVPFDGSRVV